MALHLRPLPPETAEIHYFPLSTPKRTFVAIQLENLVSAMAIHIGPERARYVFLEASLEAIVAQASRAGNLPSARFAVEYLLRQEFANAEAARRHVQQNPDFRPVA